MSDAGMGKGARHAVAAGYLGWMLDAYDFFILVFVLPELAAQFGTSIAEVSRALLFTLALRPVGAFLFGRLADRFGRRHVLAVNIVLYSTFAFLTAFAPSLTIFLLIRSLFGIAMGGIWGVGASLAFESSPAPARGFISGVMQAGYPSGYLLAALAYGLLYALVGWRGLFMIGVIPAALLILYVEFVVPESPGWRSTSVGIASTVHTLTRNWKVGLYAIALMTGFTFFSHGTQDFYPVFLQKSHGFSHATVSAIAVIYNIGAILGGLVFGTISQKIGRRRAIIAAALLALPVTVLWAYSSSALMLGIGAFLMQFFVQGAWGVVPAQLNELSPPGARGTFAGTVYQLGNLIASTNATIQPSIAAATGGSYAFALAMVAVAASLSISLIVWLGPEARNVRMADDAA